MWLVTYSISRFLPFLGNPSKHEIVIRRQTVNCARIHRISSLPFLTAASLSATPKASVRRIPMRSKNSFALSGCDDISPVTKPIWLRLFAHLMNRNGIKRLVMRDIDSDGGGGGITNANNIVIIIDGLGGRCASTQKAENRYDANSTISIFCSSNTNCFGCSESSLSSFFHCLYISIRRKQISNMFSQQTANEERFSSSEYKDIKHSGRLSWRLGARS